jgi:hypothetical protein
MAEEPVEPESGNEAEPDDEVRHEEVKSDTGPHGWRERHKAKLIAELDDTSDSEHAEDSVEDSLKEKWKIVGESPIRPFN